MALHDPGSIPNLLVLAVSAVAFGARAVSVQLRVGRVGLTWRRALVLVVAVTVGVVRGLGMGHGLLPVVTLSTLLILSVLFGIGVWFDVSSDPPDDDRRP